MNFVHQPISDLVALRVIAEARKEFFVHGFLGVTMDDLADEMGMSKKTLYKHFPTKEALLESVLQQKFEDLEREIQTLTTLDLPDIRTRLSKTVSCLMNHMEEIRPAFIRDLSRSAPKAFAFVQTRRRYFITTYIRKAIEDGIQSGEMRPDISSQLAIEILLGAITAIMNPAKLDELGLLPQQVASSIFTVLLEGLLVREEGVK